MMKRIVSMILLISALPVCFSSCKKIDKDPFKNETVETIETTDKFHSEIIDEFYSMTYAESVAKYGKWYMAWPPIFEDSNYFYATLQKTGFRIIGGRKEEFQYPVLYKTPHGEKIHDGIPVCSDPMCDHKPGSGCVFDGIKVLTIAADKLYFCAYEIVNVNGDAKSFCKIYRYDDKKNQKILIDQSQTHIYMQTYEQDLYYYKTIEDENFNAKNLCYKLDQNDKPELFYEGEAQPYTHYLFCGEKKLITTSQNIEKGTTKIGTLDCSTGETHTVTERSDMTIHGMYGSKLLYSTSGSNDTYYLYDTEKDKITEFYSYKNEDGVLPLRHTNRCLIYCDIRKDSSEPFILHIYFPGTETEESYNLSEMIDEPIGIRVYPGVLERGAITLKTYSDSKHEWVKIYEIDLKSGKVKDLRTNEE